MNDTIFELVEVTEEETYWPLGVFLTLDDAKLEIGGTPDDFGNPLDRDECCVVEIRERKIGWHPLQVGKTVHRKAWNMEYPEDADSYWKECL